MIYFLHDERSKAVKIGYAKDDVSGRRDVLQTGNPNPLIVMGKLFGERADEAALHHHFANRRIQPGTRNGSGPTRNS